MHLCKFLSILVVEKGMHYFTHGIKRLATSYQFLIKGIQRKGKTFNLKNAGLFSENRFVWYLLSKTLNKCLILLRLDTQSSKQIKSEAILFRGWPGSNLFA